MENNKLRSSLQTPAEPVPNTDVTFVTPADGFTDPLSPAYELKSVLHFRSVFSARTTISGAGLKTVYKGLDSITSLFHTGSSAG